MRRSPSQLARWRCAGGGGIDADGLELGRITAPLLAQRWEQGWDRPLADWREHLGIATLVARSPFQISS